MKCITMVTSIAPKDMELQKLALDSWINAGFRVVSCNISDEIQIIKKNFPRVEFVEMKKDGREVMGKPCPYIYDMLQVAKERAEDVCGIVNSDIHLHKFTNDMYAYIYEQAKEQLLFMRRNDIDKLEDIDSLNYQMYLGGIDVFFFHKDMVRMLEDDGLLIGQAMWDYWFPIMLSEQGVKIREIVNPMIFHVRHAQRWNRDVTVSISEKICKKHFPEVERKKAIRFLTDKYFTLISAPDIGLCKVSDELAEKKVLFICQEDDRKAIEDVALCQTHQNIEVADTVENTASYDYIFSLPYHLSFSNSFADIIIWIIENYHVPALDILVHLRGKQSDILKCENCSQVEVLQRFNREIHGVRAWKAGSNLLQKDAETKLCTTYTCSMCFEERKENIWVRNKFSGRTLIYPAGRAAQMWVERYGNIAQQVQIIGFVDKAEEIQGTIIDTLPVYAPDKILQYGEYDKILVVSNRYQEEIYEMLKEKVSKDKLVVWNEFCVRNSI